MSELDGSFEKLLRHITTLDLAEKSSWYLRGKYGRRICEDCFSPPLDGENRIRACCTRCRFELMLWIFDPKIWREWQLARPPGMKKLDFEKGVREGRLIVENHFEDGTEFSINGFSKRRNVP